MAHKEGREYGAENQVEGSDIGIGTVSSRGRSPTLHALPETRPVRPLCDCPRVPGKIHPSCRLFQLHLLPSRNLLFSQGEVPGDEEEGLEC